MKNLEELKKKYEELGKEIKRLENQKKNKRWRAEVDQVYYFITQEATVDWCYDNDDSIDNFRYKTRNYFKTEEEAQRYLDNINTYYDLMDLAEELNDGEEIDWNNKHQKKYCIYYNFVDDSFDLDYHFYLKAAGQIYCLNIDFLNIAKERIGEERLKKLLKNQ